MSLLRKLGLEDASTYADAQVPQSDDEALVLEGEAQEIRYSIDSDLRSIERAEAAAIGMEDMAEIIEVMGEGDEVMPDVRAIATVAAQQVDGDVAPQDVIGTLAFELDEERKIKAELDPSEVSGTALESFHGFKGVKRSVAVESLKDRAKAIWEAIKKMVKDVIKKVKDFFYKYLGAIPRKRKAIESLKEEVKKVAEGGKRPEGKLELTSGLQRLVVGDTPVKNGKDLVKGYQDLVKSCESIGREDSIGLNKAFEEWVDLMQDMDLDKKDESLAKLKAVGMAAYVNITKAVRNLPSFPSESTDSREAHLFDTLIGDKRLVQYTRKGGSGLERGSASTDVWDSRRYESIISFMRDNTMRIVSSDKKLPDEVSFTVMTQSEMTDLLNASLKILDSVEEFQRGKIADRRQKLLARMEKASDRLAKEQDRLSGQGKQDDEDARTVSLNIVKALMNLNAALVRNTAEPATSLASHAGGQVDFAIAFVRRNMAQYKKRD